MLLARILVVASATLAVFLMDVSPVAACGCFHPPEPEDFDDEFAVNQAAEQIIFEVGEGTITAHVLIQYAGDPAAFAWMVPVPSAPELALSHSGVFSWLNDATAPSTDWNSVNQCPASAYNCRRHRAEQCPPSPDDPNVQDAGTWVDADAFADSEPGPTEPPVEVVSREQVGSYDTVVFAAEEADLAIGWLQDEGFIVNDTMTPFMQPYLDAGMLFLASRLIPGAGVEEIRPLRMTFVADNPMIPLQLTAIAADPHLTVTSYVVGDSTFEPTAQPIVGVDPSQFAVDAAGRTNYPMLLSRTIDDAGGAAFVVEYSGAMPRASLGDTECCGQGFDLCAAGTDGRCQCPLDDWDQEDCSEVPDLADLAEGIERVALYPYVTRLTTRLSPHEMTFDPVFRPTLVLRSQPRRSYSATRPEIERCVDDLVDSDAWETFDVASACATVYCDAGTCAVSDGAAGCVCDEGFVGRTFRDLDGAFSVTCVPETPPVDFSAGGLVLKSACEDEGESCVDVGGFLARRCAEGEVAVAQLGPVCLPITDEVDAGPGGFDSHTDLLVDVEICIPAPATDCGEFGWLEYVEPRSQFAVMCEQSNPDPALLEIPPLPPEPDCPEYDTGDATDDASGDTSNDASNDASGDTSNDATGATTNDATGDTSNDATGATTNDATGATTNDTIDDGRGCATSTSRSAQGWFLGLAFFVAGSRRRRTRALASAPRESLLSA
ncbi:MAG: hypothetical protein ACJAYU_001725 [Bradymonadia bacterium]|jgi:hypothetical protein